MGLHGDITEDDGVHVIYFNTFVDLTAAEAYSYTSADIGKVVRVGSGEPYSFYFVTDATTPVLSAASVSGHEATYDHSLIPSALPVPIAEGGTGAATAGAALSALGAEASANKGIANGYAELDSGGKVPAAQLPLSNFYERKGTWDANANSPSLSSGTGDDGDTYLVTTAGTTNLDGITDWQVGDLAIFLDSAWRKIDNTDAVNSVAGLTGTITDSSLRSALNVENGADVTDLTNVLSVLESVTTEIVEIGDPGTESSGININGTTYTAKMRVNDIGGSTPAHFIAHRHSTTIHPLIVTARSNSDTSSHGTISGGQTLASWYSCGWTGTHYDIFAGLAFLAGTGTISGTSSPGKFIVQLCPDGSNTLGTVFSIDSDGTAEITGAGLTNASLGGSFRHYVPYAAIAPKDSGDRTAVQKVRFTDDITITQILAIPRGATFSSTLSNVTLAASADGNNLFDASTKTLDGGTVDVSPIDNTDLTGTTANLDIDADTDIILTLVIPDDTTPAPTDGVPGAYVEVIIEYVYQ